MKFDEVAALSPKSNNELFLKLVSPPSSASAGGQLCAVTRPSCQVQPLVHIKLTARAQNFVSIQTHHQNNNANRTRNKNN
jgi:hypothetical protein